MNRGLFFSLDGLDGCGKSTQVRLLADWLREEGHTVVACVDPGGTPLGLELRGLLLQQKHVLSLPAEMFLFMASRAQLVAEVIRPALDEGAIVVSDRFLLANVVYQGHAGGMDAKALWDVGNLATGGLEPDLTLVLDLPVALARSRRKGPSDAVERRDEAYHERVRQGFLAEARRRPKSIHVIDAAAPLETVQQAIRKEVRHVLAARPRA